MKTGLKTKIAFMIFLIVLLFGTIFLFGYSLGIFDREIPKQPFRVSNESGQQFQMLGLYWDHHLLLHRATDEDVRQAVFPGKLLEGLEAVQVVGITKENKVYVSGPENVKGKKQLVVKAVQPVVGDSIPLLAQLPSLEQWETARKGGKVSAGFQADTALAYRVFVLGRGTVLAPSEWDTKNAPVTVSWEENRGMTQSWLLFRDE